MVTEGLTTPEESEARFQEKTGGLKAWKSQAEGNGNKRKKGAGSRAT